MVFASGNQGILEKSTSGDVSTGVKLVKELVRVAEAGMLLTNVSLLNQLKELIRVYVGQGQTAEPGCIKCKTMHDTKTSI